MQRINHKNHIEYRHREYSKIQALRKTFKNTSETTKLIYNATTDIWALNVQKNPYPDRMGWRYNP